MTNDEMTWKQRFEWLADKVLAADYGDNEYRQLGHGQGYFIKHCKGPQWIEGNSIVEAVDAAIKNRTINAAPPVVRAHDVSEGSADLMGDGRTNSEALAVAAPLDDKRDAERYRWLRENPELVIDDMDNSMLIDHDALDLTVDAAMNARRKA